MGPRTGLVAGAENLAPAGIRSPDRPARSPVAGNRKMPLTFSPKTKCFVRKISLRKILPDSEFPTGMTFTIHEKVSGPSSDPTTLQYGHVQRQLKCTEEDVWIQNNNSAQFSVTDVHHDKDFAGSTKIPVRCYATVPHTQPFHTVNVYSSQTYLLLNIQQPFYTI